MERWRGRRETQEGGEGGGKLSSDGGGRGWRGGGGAPFTQGPLCVGMCDGALCNPPMGRTPVSLPPHKDGYFAIKSLLKYLCLPLAVLLLT